MDATDWAVRAKRIFYQVFSGLCKMVCICFLALLPSLASGENRIAYSWTKTGGSDPSSGSGEFVGGSIGGAENFDYSGPEHSIAVNFWAIDPEDEDEVNWEDLGANLAFGLREISEDGAVGTHSFGPSYFRMLRVRDFSPYYVGISCWRGCTLPNGVESLTRDGSITITTDSPDRIAGSIVYDEVVVYDNGETLTYHIEGAFDVDKGFGLLSGTRSPQPISYTYEIAGGEVVANPSEERESLPVTIRPIVPEGMEFLYWETTTEPSIYFHDQDDGTHVFNLPWNTYHALDESTGQIEEFPTGQVRIEAIFRELDPPPDPGLTITKHTPDGTTVIPGYDAGQVETIWAPAVSPDGRVFQGWAGDIAYLDDPSANSTTITMPDQSVELTAEYTEALGFDTMDMPGTYTRWDEWEGVEYKETLVFHANGEGSYTDGEISLSLTWEIDEEGILILNVEGVGELRYALIDIVDGEWHIRGDVLDDTDTWTIGDVFMYKVETTSASDEKPNLRGVLFNVVEESVIYEETNEVTVQFEVKNVSHFATESGFHIHFYLVGESSGLRVTTEREYLGYFSVSHVLVGNQSTGMQTISLTLPSEVPDAGESEQGRYRIGMVIDPKDGVTDQEDIAETDETDNANLGLGKDYDQITIGGPSILQFSDFEVVPNRTYRPEEPVFAPGRLKNVGYGEAVKIELNAVFTRTDFYDIAGVLQSWDELVEKIPAGGVHDFGVQVRVPASKDQDLINGDGFYHVNIEADYYEERSGSYKGTRASAPLLVDVPSDLVPVELTVNVFDPPPFRPGEDVPLVFSVKNIGFGTSGETVTSIWLSRDRHLSKEDDFELLPRVATPEIPWNTRHLFLFDQFVTLPGEENVIWDEPLNRYYLLLEVDALEEEPESDESNNSSWGAAAGVDVDLQPIVSSTFDSAVAEAGLTGEDALPMATPFDDNIANLLKYAFNMNLAGPDSQQLEPGGSSGLPSGELVEEGGQTYWRVEYVRRKDGQLSYVPQKSGTLEESDFAPLTGGETVSDIPEAPGWERVVIGEPCDPATEDRCFFRVEVDGM